MPPPAPKQSEPPVLCSSAFQRPNALECTLDGVTGPLDMRIPMDMPQIELSANHRGTEDQAELGDLETWQENSNAWEEEEDAGWQAEEVLRQQKLAEREKRSAEQQRKKMEKEAQRQIKKDQSKMGVKLS